MKTLQSFLRKHRRIALDTNVFIYALEPNPKYAALADHVFTWLEKLGHSAVTSTVTLTEVLVKPYLLLEDKEIDQIQGYLLSYPNLEWIVADGEVAELAAELRATHRLKTPDALQAATAIQAGVTGFVTNDKIFERVPAFETLVLDNLL